MALEPGIPKRGTLDQKSRYITFTIPLEAILGRFEKLK